MDLGDLWAVRYSHAKITGEGKRKGLRMKQQDRLIGVHQFTILVICFGIGTSILVAPASLAADAAQDAWISALIAIIAALIPVAVYVGLAKRFPKQSLIEMNEAVFGKWLGKAISLLYVSFFLLLASLMLGDAGYFLTTEVMPETPIDFIMACLLVVVVMGTRLGPEGFARACEIFFPWVVLLFSILVLMLLPEIEIEKMLPVWENGFAPIAKASLPFVSLQEYVVLMMVYPYVKNSKKTAPAFFVGTLIAGAFLFIIMLLCIIVLGPGLTAENNYPSFTLAKKVSIGRFFERVEVIIGGLWFITITFKIVITFFAANIGTSQIFRFKSYSFLTIPMAMLCLVVVLMSYTNYVLVADFIHRVWPAYALTFMVVLPLFTLLTASVRRLKQ
jgi:spore germination protein KB